MPSTTGEVTARDGTRLRTRRWAADGSPWASLVLVHGLAEHSGRYERAGATLAAAGVDVHAFDLRGHGGSGGPRGDIARWEDLHDDVEDALRRVRASDGADGRPVALLGHSMGGLVVLDYALAGRPVPDLLVLSSPALEDGLPAWQHGLVRVVGRIVPTMRVANSWDGATLSRDPAVGEAVAADPDCLARITLRTGCGGFAAQARARRHLRRLDIPTWVHHGGDDRLVPPRASEPLASLPVVTRHLYPGLRHECLNEPEGPQVLTDILAWLRDRANVPSDAPVGSAGTPGARV